MKSMICSTLFIPMLLLLTVINSLAQSRVSQQAISQVKVQQIQTMLNVSPQQAMTIQGALNYKQMEIWLIKKSSTYSIQQKEQLLQPLLAQRKARLDSVMTRAQQEMFAKKQQQLKEAAVLAMKQGLEQTRQRLLHPVSGGVYKPVTTP